MLQGNWTFKTEPMTLVCELRPLFCNLSASRKRRGRLICGIWHFILWIPPLLVPRLDVDIGTLYYRPTEAADLPSLLILLSRSPEPQKLDGQDWLTEVGHSVDSGFVLSMCYCWLTPLANMLAIDGEFISCSMGDGFILVLPPGPWTWRCRSFNEDHFGRMAMVGGPICGIKIRVQELWLKM